MRQTLARQMDMSMATCRQETAQERRGEGRGEEEEGEEVEVEEEEGEQWKRRSGAAKMKLAVAK